MEKTVRGWEPHKERKGERANVKRGGARRETSKNGESRGQMGRGRWGAG